MIASSGNGNILLDDLFTIPAINVLWAIVTDKRFEKGDPKMDLLTASMNGFLRFSNGGPNLLSLLPFLRFIAPESTGYNKLFGYIKPIRDYVQVHYSATKMCIFIQWLFYIKDVIAEHRKTRNPGDPRDFIDVYLEMLDDKQDDPNFNGKQRSEWFALIYFSCFFCLDVQLLGIIFDMFVAGSETTSHTLGFALLLMILNQDVQSKVQDEIELVLQGNFPTLADRGR